MQQTPLILFITGFVTGFLGTWIGLLLVNIKPNLLKLIVVALFYSVMNIIVRSSPIPLGTHFFLLTVLLYILIMVSWRLSLLRALIPAILGMLVLLLGESLSVTFVIRVSQLNMSDLMQGWVILWAFIPEILLMLLVIHLIYRFKLHVFDFYNSDNSSIAESNLVTILTGTMLLLLVSQFVLTLSTLYAYPYHFFKISLEDAGVLCSILMIAVFLITVVVINQFLVLSAKENEYMVQLAYLSTLDELNTAIRAEGHDRINHLQTLYGFVQLGNLKETQNYLEDLMGDITISHHYVVQGNPGLSALFYIKSGIAISEGIQLNLKIESNIAQIAVPSYELNRIIGNLVNNAFDAVAKQEKGNRWVNIHISEQMSNYTFKVSNYGDIDREQINRIFSRGYTTKHNGHSGLGLYIIAGLVEKYGGEIMLENKKNMVEFTVVLPKTKPGGEINALSGSSTGPKTGSEFRASI